MPCSAQVLSFFPVEVGDRWLYRQEVFNGGRIGSYSIETCTVEITAETFESQEGRTYFSSSLLGGGGPCQQERATKLRKDERGNIVIRPPRPFAQPDTTTYLDANPEFADAFRERLARLPAAADELLFIDFDLYGVYGVVEDPFLRSFWNWYSTPAARALGQVPLRHSYSADERPFPLSFERLIPPPFIPGAERALIVFEGVVEYDRISLLEEGIGLVADYQAGIISPDVYTTVLVWARVGGIEYGLRPTAVAGSSWAEVKRR